MKALVHVYVKNYKNCWLNFRVCSNRAVRRAIAYQYCVLTDSRIVLHDWDDVTAPSTEFSDCHSRCDDRTSRMLARRMEVCVRNDWLVVPAARNLKTKWKALCRDDAACRHPVDTDKPRTELAAELSDATAKLYVKLAQGYYWDNYKKPKINHDFTKLPYAMDLMPSERRLVKF